MKCVAGIYGFVFSIFIFEFLVFIFFQIFFCLFSVSCFYRFRVNSLRACASGPNTNANQLFNRYNGSNV